MKLKEILNENLIVLNSNIDNKDDVIDFLAELLFKDGKVSDKNLFIQAVYLRESQGETGIGEAIAIPHGISDYVVKSSCAIVRLNKKIKWESINGEDVDLIFMLAISNTERDKVQIKLLARLASVLADTQVLEDLRKIENSKDFLNEFSKHFDNIVI